MTQDDMTARDAAGVQVLRDAYARWADLPPVQLSMKRQDAWLVLVLTQKAAGSPAFDGGQLAEDIRDVGRQFQAAVCDVPELHAVAEEGWTLGAGRTSTEAETARLFAAAFARWESLPLAEVSMTRRLAWTLMTALQLMAAHPDVDPLLTGTAERFARAFQEALCDDPELYAIAESGWNRAADVPQGGHR
ncbi:hypothetical protein [Streptomyces sp. NPDC001108]